MQVTRILANVSSFRADSVFTLDYLCLHSGQKTDSRCGPQAPFCFFIHTTISRLSHRGIAFASEHGRVGSLCNGPGVLLPSIPTLFDSVGGNNRFGAYIGAENPAFKSRKLLSRSTFPFQSIRLTAYLAVPALIVIWGAWNNNRLEITNLSVELPQRSSSIKNLHIVFASDFHLSQITSEHMVGDFVAKVNDLKPDILLIGGDVLEGDREEDLEKYEAEFRRSDRDMAFMLLPAITRDIAAMPAVFMRDPE